MSVKKVNADKKKKQKYLGKKEIGLGRPLMHHAKPCKKTSTKGSKPENYGQNNAKPQYVLLPLHSMGTLLKMIKPPKKQLSILAVVSSRIITISNPACMQGFSYENSVN
jgi:hypothetical protein